MQNRFAQNIIFIKQTKKVGKPEPIQICIRHPVFGPPFTPKPLFQCEMNDIYKVMKSH
jgi:hypothetical protein